MRNVELPGARSLTVHRASGSIAAVNRFVAGLLLLGCVSCTTLENRRDLYRSPAEGYEQWHRHPPPTRLRAGGQAPTTTTGRTTTTVERHGVITFPEETLPEPDQ